MKKIYYIIILIVFLIFLYYFASSLPSFTEKIFVIASDSINSSTFSSVGTFGFKSTLERTDLLNEMININSQFIKDPPIKFPKVNDDIKYFYKLEKCFTNFNDYYLAKIKVQEALVNELKNLCSATSSLSDDELKQYFSSNTEYLNKKWGVDNFNDFSDLVLTIKELDGKEIISYELEESYFYISSNNTVNFRIILTPSDNVPVYVAGIIEIYNSNNYQTSPLVRFWGTKTLGGGIF